jgi:hypothetical protein
MGSMPCFELLAQHTCFELLAQHKASLQRHIFYFDTYLVHAGILESSTVNFLPLRSNTSLTHGSVI